MGLIWNQNLGLNICLGSYTSLDIYICAIFVFACTHSVILLAEYEWMTRGTCCKFILVHVLSYTFILF